MSIDNRADAFGRCHRDLCICVVAPQRDATRAATPVRISPVAAVLAVIVAVACRMSTTPPQPRPVLAPHPIAHLDAAIADAAADATAASPDRTDAATPVDASSLWADRVPRGMIAARFEEGYVRWPDAGEETYDPVPPGLVDWLQSTDGEVTVQVFAGPRSEINAPDLETWALRAMERFAPQADLSERSLWPGQYFRYRRAADGTRHAELRLLQVEWRMADDTRHRDVLVGLSERGDVLYRTFVTLDCGAAWWDAPEPPPEGPLPRALLRRGREAHSRYIVGPQPR